MALVITSTEGWFCEIVLVFSHGNREFAFVTGSRDLGV